MVIADRPEPVKGWAENTQIIDRQSVHGSTGSSRTA